MGIAEDFKANKGTFEIDLQTRHFIAPSIPIVAIRMELPAGNQATTHKHNYDHWSIIAEGKGMLITDEGSCPYHAGDCLFIKAGLNHQFSAVSDTMWFCVHHSAEKEQAKVDQTLIMDEDAE
jgi:quercetin dioxygenase-like cupin family protein